MDRITITLDKGVLEYIDSEVSRLRRAGCKTTRSGYVRDFVKAQMRRDMELNKLFTREIVENE